VSVKDRWVGSCEQVLNVLFVNRSLTFSTASMAVRGEKLGGEPQIG
jgi:hypothetical protein